jgi:hypothetical protein
MTIIKKVQLIFQGHVTSYTRGITGMKDRLEVTMHAKYDGHHSRNSAVLQRCICVYLRDTKSDCTVNSSRSIIIRVLQLLSFRLW